MAETSQTRKNHSVWLFYLLAFGWTWLFWGALALHEQGLVTLPDGLYRFLDGPNPGAWGPLLAALLLKNQKGLSLSGLVNNLFTK